MASPDPQGLTPSGALSRHPADWFTDQLYTVGFQQIFDATITGAKYTTVGFYNADTQGRICKIYGISADSDGGDALQCFFVHGTVGALASTAKSIRPDYPTPNVSIYQQNTNINPPGPNPYISTLGDIYGMIGTSGYDSMTYVSPFPFFIVPVGWSLVLTNAEPAIATGASFWFLLVNK